MPVAFGKLVRIYIKPSLGGAVIFRSKTSKQTSKRLQAAKNLFASQAHGNKIAAGCRGKKWKSFVACLRAEGKKTIKRYRGRIEGQLKQEEIGE